ncbi:MAG: hypothetical protein PHZ24_12895, partial [Bacteroidales bacterium]|nr:hypothetical protein [Bacteroidales bacterium]MDY0143110.1 hypothetical protein [Bacteroidales bacterium]
RNISQRQDYTGTITVDTDGTVRMSGTFTQLGTSTVYKWHSEKTVKTTQSSVQPASNPTTGGTYNLRGDWNHEGNGHKTKLVVAEQNGDKFSGTMHGNPLINGKINGNTVTFTRNISQRQDYTGTITVDTDGTVRMSGTFTQLGTSTVYKWHSEKVEKQKN